MKIVGISGAITGSKTKIAVQFALDHIQANHPGAETELIDLSQNEMIFSDGRDFRDYTGDTANVTATIMAADAILIGTPTYQASISGALKNVLDLLPERAFQEKKKRCDYHHSWLTKTLPRRRTAIKTNPGLYESSNCAELRVHRRTAIRSRSNCGRRRNTPITTFGRRPRVRNPSTPRNHQTKRRTLRFLNKKRLYNHIPHRDITV